MLLRARGVEPGVCYRREYALLAPFVPLMLWSFAAPAGLVSEGGVWKSVIVFAYALTCLAATLWNYRALLRRAPSDGGRE